MKDNIKIYEEIAEKLKVIAHPQRLCIVKGLVENKCNVSKIQECIELPQSTVSQHLSKLKSAGIIEGKRNGTEVCYQVTDEKIIEFIKLFFEE
jgi:ArsR family transcriptional regulator